MQMTSVFHDGPVPACRTAKSYPPKGDGGIAGKASDSSMFLADPPSPRGDTLGPSRCLYYRGPGYNSDSPCAMHGSEGAVKALQKILPLPTRASDGRW